jgi:hypothetical protein
VEIFIERLGLELVAIALQFALWRMVCWLRNRWASPSAVVAAT